MFGLPLFSFESIITQSSPKKEFVYLLPKRNGIKPASVQLWSYFCYRAVTFSYRAGTITYLVCFCDHTHKHKRNALLPSKRDLSEYFIGPVGELQEDLSRFINEHSQGL